MAEYSTPEERTETPTDRRMGELRRQGSVHMSHDVAVVASLLMGFVVLQLTWSWLLGVMKEILIRSFHAIASPAPLTADSLHNGLITLLVKVAPPVAVISLMVSLAAFLAVMLQTKWNIKEKKVDFKLNFLNPMTGLKRIFSVQGAMSTLKAIVKLAIILPIGFFALRAYAPQMVMLVHLTVDDVLSFTGMSMMFIFWKIMYVLIALAIFDYFWSKFQWNRNYRMTKDEVKDDRKALEGDETTKRRIIAKGLQRIRQRIMQSVPQADVVVTNPTHFAVALKYDREKMNAPTVVAKGRGFLALRIREIARQAGVPIIERKTLARALYHSVEVGAEIPNELFRAAAEVLAYVYRLRRPRSAPVGAQGAGVNAGT
jgi:flagellar biosynthesis protein FlhB